MKYIKESKFLGSETWHSYLFYITLSICYAIFVSVEFSNTKEIRLSIYILIGLEQTLLFKLASNPVTSYLQTVSIFMHAILASYPQKLRLISLGLIHAEVTSFSEPRVCRPIYQRHWNRNDKIPQSAKENKLQNAAAQTQVEIVNLRIRDGAVMRELASQQCGLGSNSARTRRHMWVEFVVGSRPCSEGFSPVFPPPQKTTLLNSNSIWNPKATGLSVERLLSVTLVKQSRLFSVLNGFARIQRESRELLFARIICMLYVLFCCCLFVLGFFHAACRKLLHNVEIKSIFV